MPYWKTRNQVKVGLALAGVLFLNACQRNAQPRTEQASTGIVTGVLGIELSGTPDAQPHAKASGSLALLVEERLLNTTNWRRLIASDGSYGWTSRALTQLHPVTITARSEPFSLKSKSPDDTSFDESPEIAVSMTETGVVEGASGTSRPAFPQDMMVPPHLSRMILPWLRLRFGTALGYAALPWIDLHWPPTTGEQVDLDSALRDLGAEGVLTGPFLAPLRPALRALEPRAGDPLFVFGAANQPPSAQPSPSGFDRAEMLVRNGASKLAVFSKGHARVFTFSEPGSVLRILAEEDNPSIGRVEIRDLGSDGKPEWLLEVVSTYGDGYYSELWVIDASSQGETRQGKTPMMDRLALSHNSSEGRGQAVESSWWVSPENKLWVMSAENSGPSIASYSHASGKLTANRAGAPRVPVVVLASANDLREAGQAYLKANRTSTAAGLFTQRNGSVVSFIVARPFETENAARAFLQEHAGARVIHAAPAKLTGAGTR